VPTDSREPGPMPPPPHDPTGLDLARSIARSLGTRPGTGAARPKRPGAGAGRRRRRGVDPLISGAYPDDRDPQTLGATMDRLVAEHGWTTEVAVHGVFSRWDQIVGLEVARHCHPEAYADGSLTVRADSTAWATQVRLLAAMVVRRLNEELGHDTVLRIQVHGPQQPTWTKGRRSVRDGRGPRDTYG